MDSFSQKLAGARKKLNLSIEEIAEETKIRHNILEAIEAGDYTVLPEVYLRSFIKTYALYMKFSEAEIKSSLDRIFVKKETASVPVPQLQAERKPDKAKERQKDQSKEKAVEKKKEPEPPKAAPKVAEEKNTETADDKKEAKQRQAELKKILREENRLQKEKLKQMKKEEKEKQKQDKKAEKDRQKESSKEPEKPTTRNLDQESLNSIFFGGGAGKKSTWRSVLKWTGMVVGVIALVFIVLMLFWPDSTKFLNNFLTEEDKKKISGDTAQVQNANPIENQKVVLVARAIDTTSFRIHIDNQTDESITLYPGKSKLWEAIRQIDLSGVIVGTVEFTRNNELLPPFGESGSIVRKITIFRDKIQSSSGYFEKDTIPFVTPGLFIPEEK